MQTAGHPILGKLGDFEVLRELGRGGMGIVYEARQVSLNRKVALKVLSGALGLTGKAVTRFKREAETAAKLHHTNIVPIYATGEEDGTHFYAMELIEGPSLDQVIRQMRKQPEALSNTYQVSPTFALASTIVECKAVSNATTACGDEHGPGSFPSPAATTTLLAEGSSYFDTVARLIAEVADGLDYAHKQGVVHRDIKPSNLLLSSDGQLHINDFGLARMLEQPGLTISGEFLGSPAYMSPEQIAAGRLPLDHRTDIYSLGVVLYELLTLQPPFAGTSRDQILAQIVQKEPRPPRVMNKRVPVDLETICLKAIEKDPDRRYQSASAMAEDLRRYLNRFAISARRTGWIGRTLKWTRRHPALAFACTSCLIACLVSVFLTLNMRSQKRHAALEKALLFSMSGDLKAAAQAIEEAELAGVSLGEIRMLRGQVALHSGDYSEAVQHLEQAVRLLPKSVAALSMLATAYTFNTQWEKAEDLHLKLRDLAPSTPEDYLFKGQALPDFREGIKLLDEAVERRDGRIARLTRAEVLAWLAIDTGRRSDIDRALADAAIAKAMLPDNPRAHAISLMAHSISAALHAEAGDESARQASWAHAASDARVLEKFPHSPIAVVHRCYFYLMHSGAWDAAAVSFAQALRERKNNFLAWWYSYLLYRQGHYSRALEVIDQHRTTRDVAGDHSRAFYLAELENGPERAREAYLEFKERFHAPIAMLHGPTILQYLGRQDEAAAEYLRMRDQLANLLRTGSIMPLWIRLLEYQCGELSEEALLNHVRDSRSGRCYAHFTIALRHLAERNRTSARAHFKMAAATHAMTWFAYDWSLAFLARMEQDPTWPPWIPYQEEIQ